MCATLRKFSPVACECIAECLRHGHEVCAPGSYGCQFPWKHQARLFTKRKGTADVATRDGFHSDLPCLAPPAGTTPHSGLPAPPGTRLVSFAAYSAQGAAASGAAVSSSLTVYLAGRPGREGRPADAVWLAEAECGMRACSSRGRCLQSSGGSKGRGKRRGKGRGVTTSCVCVDGAYGRACELGCENDCFNSCSGHGTCVHGWCRCDPGWFGTDCSDTLGLRYSRASLPHDVHQFGHGPVHAQVEQLPPELKVHADRLRGRVYMYDLPANINRRSEVWMWKQWGVHHEGGNGCDPVYNRRIYAAQSHFDAHLLHDDFARTLDATQASLFYVPVFLNQRVTWGADLRTPHTPMLAALEHIKHAYPWWNASGGRNHVWFVFGERQTCLVPAEIAASSIVIGHWGDEACISATKDVVVPTITPIQHDLPRFHQRLQKAMRAASAQTWERRGPLLLFAGGIMSFGASQDNIRKSGNDTEDKRLKWLRRVERDSCARPEVSCRNIYSMGVRQAVWRQKLWAEPDMRIVSAGIPDYLQAARQAHFCLHTEGNGWGARIVDYMAMECLPLMLNDEMVFPYANILDWSRFSVHMRKREIPQVAARLRNITGAAQDAMHEVARRYKRGFVWWRPEGLAYEFTLAALGQRVASLGLEPAHGMV